MTPHDFTTSESSASGYAQSLGFVVSVCLCGVLAFCFVKGVVAGPEVSSVCLGGTLNPNTASPVSLIRLPRVGLTRAQAIVAFRDRFREETGRDAPFRCPGDLQQISGIGPKTVEDIAEWLRFDPPDDESAKRAENGPSPR